jgi:hypothetical protein
MQRTNLRTCGSAARKSQNSQMSFVKPSENFRAVVAVTSLRTAVKDLTGFMESEPVATPAWTKIRIDQTPAGTCQVYLI